MSDKHLSLFPVDATMPLDQMGYDKGSQITVIVNPTRTWRLDWSDTFALKRNKGENDTDYSRRIYQAQYELAAKVIKSVTVKKAGEKWERKSITAADLQELDEEIDSELVTFAISEMLERSAARSVSQRYTFRAERTRSVKGGQESQESAPVSSDKSTDSDL